MRRPLNDGGRTPSAGAGARFGGRPGTNFQRTGGKDGPQKGGKPAIDKRRRREKTTTRDEDLDAWAEADQAADEFISKHVDRPETASEPLPYDPKQLQLKDLAADWPNTPVSTIGVTESVIQKIEWLSKRIPHGYVTPQDLAQRYLKGDFVRFESEEEKQEVVKIAFEEKAKREKAGEEGTIHKAVPGRFRLRKDPVFMSLADSEKVDDKNFLLNSNVKGEYGKVAKHSYGFLDETARLLNNNETYGPVQAQKLLDRIQSLIPQARAGRVQKQKAKA